MKKKTTKTTIKISLNLRQVLLQLKKFDEESYESVIWRLYEQNMKPRIIKA